MSVKKRLNQRKGIIVPQNHYQSLTFPIRHSSIEHLHLVLSRSTQMVDKEIPENLSSDTVWRHESFRSSLKGGSQLWDGILGDSWSTDRSIWQIKLLLDASQTEREDRTECQVRYHLRYPRKSAQGQAGMTCSLTSAPGTLISNLVA